MRNFHVDLAEGEYVEPVPLSMLAWEENVWAARQKVEEVGRRLG